MQVLLDTHILLWSVSATKQLPDHICKIISHNENMVFVSIASLWELRIKETIKKINLPANFYTALAPAGYEILPINIKHIQKYGALPMHHRDPFDRMLVAQAIVEQLTFITNDHHCTKYGAQTIFAK